VSGVSALVIDDSMATEWWGDSVATLPRAPSLSQMARTAVATSDSRGVPSE